MTEKLRVNLLGTPLARTGEGELAFMPDLRYFCLAYLARAGDWVTRDDLIYLFWPDTPQDKAREKLRHLLYRIRKLGWTGDLEADAHRVRWSVETDVALFDAAIKARAWERAITFYTGPLLLGLEGRPPEFAAWLDLERADLARAYQRAALARSDELSGVGNYAEAADLLGELHRAEPTDERVFQRYLARLMEAGDTQGAEAAFEVFRETLRVEFGTEPEPLTQDLLERKVEERRSATAVATSNPTRPLPVPATRFIGREEELAQIANLLAESDCRLLTLVGPGGMGKTRLAIEAARRLAPRYRDGVAFVALESVDDSDLIVLAVADVLGFAFYGSRPPREQLLGYLQTKHLLLVMDNLEHLTGAAEFVSVALSRCADIEILVTSRKRLRLEPEWLVMLEGLSYLRTDNAEAGALDAATLFVDRLRRIQIEPGNDESEDWQKITDICRLVEGQPLALELAATWRRVMSFADIIDKLQSPEVLDARIYSTPNRHASLRHLFEHSWQLLSTEERESLLKLSVFQGGFTDDAAREVAATDVLTLIDLADKSMLNVSQGRYSFHPLVHSFVLDLVPEARAKTFRDLHAQYFLTYLVELSSSLNSSNDKFACDAFVSDIENLRAAWLWSCAEGRIEPLDDALLPLYRFTERTRRWVLGRDLLGRIVDRLKDMTSHRATLGRAMIALAWCKLMLGSIHAAEDSAKQALTLLAQSDAAWFLKANQLLAMAAQWRCQYDITARASERGAHVAQQTGDVAMHAIFLLMVAYAKAMLGEIEAARLYVDKADHIAAKGDNESLKIVVPRIRAQVDWVDGKWEAAREGFEHALKLAETYEYASSPLTHSHALKMDLLMVALDLEDLSLAAQLLPAHLLKDPISSMEEAFDTIYLGRYFTKQNDYAKALDCFKRVCRASWEAGHLLSFFQLLLPYLTEFYIETGHYRQAAELSSFLLANDLTPHSGKAYASVFMERLRTMTEGSVLQQAQHSGRQLGLEQVIAQVLAFEL